MRGVACDLQQLFKLLSDIISINVDTREEIFYSEIGNYIYNDNDMFILFDVGDPSPSFRPGHCHNSVFHFDMHVDGENILCDSGIYEYSNTSIRNNLRSTSAHNTVKINDSELNEIWDSFRIIKGGSVNNIKIKKKSIQADHNYYFSSEKCIVRRSMKILDNEIGLIIKDKIISKKNKNTICDFLHFGPSVDVVSKHETENMIIIKFKTSSNYFSLNISKSNEEKIILGSSIFSKQFNKKENRLMIKIKCKALTQKLLKYVIKKIEKH